MKIGKRVRLRSLIFDIFAFVAIFILVQLVVSLIITKFVGGIFDANGKLTDFGFFATYFSAMVPILIIATRYESFRYGCSTLIRSSWRGFDPTMALWGLILLVAMTIAISPITNMLPYAERTSPTGGWTLLTVCIIAPIFEELIFRGRLYSMLCHSSSALLSAMLTAILFGVVHGDLRVMISGFVAGLVFSYVYIQKSSIIAPILIHMFNNAIAYALVVLSYQNKSADEIVGESVDMSIVYIVSRDISVIGMVQVDRNIRRKGVAAFPVKIEEATENAEPATEESVSE